MTTSTSTLTRTETFDCDGPAELDIGIRGGRVDVRTADVTHVRVEISVQPGDPRQWEQGVEDLLGTISQGAYTPGEADAHAVAETKVTFSEQRRRLVVRAPRGFRRTGIAVVVEAPRRSKLKAGAQRAAISTSGLLSELTAATGTGSIASEEVEGPVDVASGSGDVALGRVSGRLKARLGSGDLEVASLEGDGANVAAGRGEIWLGAVRCDAQVRSGHGSIVVAEAAGGKLTLVTGRGDLRVGIRSGVAAELDIASGSGRARSELELSDTPPADAPVARVRMRTGNGEAVVAAAGA
jgi:hypothetical protein